ncbi:MAG: hypothetical protein U9R49_00485 [Bacteroidota bacterium]|nr:hypothetical protein [Bacteroidota bacterium]
MKVKTRILFILTCLFLLVAGPLAGQNTNTIQEKKIASRTVYEYFIDKGMDEPVVESIETYDEKGELLELKEFNSKGEVKRWEQYAYNEEGKVVQEVFLNSKGKVERTEKSIYEDGLRVEKQYFNNRDKLYKRKVYEYEFRK